MSLKSIILFSCLLASSIVSLAQSKLQPFILEGTIKNHRIKIPQIFLTASFIDTNDIKIENRKVQIVDGKFHFKGMLKYPHAVHLYYEDDADTIYLSTNIFFIEAGTQKIDITSDKLVGQTPVVIGSATHSRYLQQFKPQLFEQKVKQTDSLFEALPFSYERQSANRKAYRSLYAFRDSILLKAARQPQNQLISAWLMLRYMNQSGYSEKYPKAFQSFEPIIKSNSVGKLLNSRLAQSKGKSGVGASFPMMTLKDSSQKIQTLSWDNQQISHSDYTLIDFWFSHCGPCIQQFPAIKQLVQNYPTNLISVIGVTIDGLSQAEHWKKIISENQLNWLQLMDENGVYAKQLGIQSYPSNFLVDSNGRIVARNLEMDEIEKWLASKK